VWNPDPVTHRLVLLRHAKSDRELDVVDIRRPLAARGRRQAAEVGPALVAAGLVPNLALCSTAQRARQTWELVAASLVAASPHDEASSGGGSGGEPTAAHLDDGPAVTFLDELYGASVDGVLAAVRRVDESVGTLLVVGHEPTISRTATALAGLGSDDATYVRIQLGVPTAAWSVSTVLGPWAELARGGALLERLHVPA